MKKIKNLLATLNQKLDGDISDEVAQQHERQLRDPDQVKEPTKDVEAGIDRLFALPLSPILTPMSNVAAKGWSGLRSAMSKALGSSADDMAGVEQAWREPVFDPLDAAPTSRAEPHVARSAPPRESFANAPVRTTSSIAPQRVEPSIAHSRIETHIASQRVAADVPSQRSASYAPQQRAESIPLQQQHSAGVLPVNRESVAARPVTPISTAQPFDTLSAQKVAATARPQSAMTSQAATPISPEAMPELRDAPKVGRRDIPPSPFSEPDSVSPATPRAAWVPTQRRELPTIDIGQIQKNLALSQRKLAAEGAKMPSREQPAPLPLIDPAEIRSRLQEIHAKPVVVEPAPRRSLHRAPAAPQQSAPHAKPSTNTITHSVKPPLSPPTMIHRKGIAPQQLQGVSSSNIPMGSVADMVEVRSELKTNSAAFSDVAEPTIEAQQAVQFAADATPFAELDDAAFYPVIDAVPDFEPQSASMAATKVIRPSSFLRPDELGAASKSLPKPNSAWGECEGGLCLPLALLRPPLPSTQTVTQEDLLERSILIEEKLTEFKVKVSVLDAYAGPVITRFEVEPAMGVRGAQVVNLAKDLARSLGLAAVRVVETIPGKTCMGLELPNPTRQMIRLSEILSAPEYQQQTSPITIALGKDITGLPVATDLAKTPHMLVAGTTGSGKSVGVNAMILSILFKATPDEVRFIMIDPKMLELSIYEGIPHLLAPVVTDMKLAANALNWCVGEMEKRYRLMSAMGVRNLAGFNQKVADAAANGRKLTNPFTLTPEDPEPLEHLPLIVVVVDEFADLMMVAGKKIEELIARLAQKARAAGIHLILATQRPSVDVITGLIKANIPTRLAFQVSSKIDSRTILDQMGAEALLGQGDMLFLPPGTGYPTRIHGAFVDDAEVHCVVEYLKQLGEPNYVEGVLHPVAGEDSGTSGWSSGAEGEESDPLYDEAVALVLKSRRASISGVQRQMRIGYNRAARLIEQMEAAGLVSAMETSGNRTVLAPPLAE